MALIVTIFPLVLGMTVVIMAIVKKTKKLRPEKALENDKNENWEVNPNVEGDRDRSRDDELVRGGHGGR